MDFTEGFLPICGKNGSTCAVVREASCGEGPQHVRFAMQGKRQSDKAGAFNHPHHRPSKSRAANGGGQAGTPHRAADRKGQAKEGGHRRKRTTQPPTGAVRAFESSCSHRLSVCLSAFLAAGFLFWLQYTNRCIYKSVKNQTKIE